MKLPTCLLGYVRGPVRAERCGGGDLYSHEPNKFILFEPPFEIRIYGQYAVTHLQKRSKFGFLLMSHEKWWQICFHVWFTFRYQQKDSLSEWIPGTEKVLYWRFGWSRWDAGDCKYITWPIGFGTWYGGLHWD